MNVEWLERLMKAVDPDRRIAEPLRARGIPSTKGGEHDLIEQDEVVEGRGAKPLSPGAFDRGR
jgi:hypothetical protein